MTPCQVTVFITAVANIIAEDKSDREIAVLSAMFIQLADTLATLSVLKDGENTIEEIRTITT